MAQAIEVFNLNKLVKDLKKLSPNLVRDFQRGLTKAVTPVRDEARRFVPNDNPITNWRQVEPTYQSLSWVNDFEHRGRDAGYRWNWSPSLVRRGIKVSRTRIKTNRGNTFFAEQVTALSLINSEAPGIIYELAGSGNSRSVSRTKRVSRNPDSRADFVRPLNTRRGKGKRLIYKAAAIKGKKALDDIQHVLDTRLYKFVGGR